MGLMSQLQLEMSTWTNKITDFTYLCHVNQQPVICPHVLLLLLLLLLLGQRHGDSDQIHSAMLNTRYPGLINWTVDFLTCIKQHTQTHTHSHTQTHTHTHTQRHTHTHSETHNSTVSVVGSHRDSILFQGTPLFILLSSNMYQDKWDSCVFIFSAFLGGICLEGFVVYETWCASVIKAHMKNIGCYICVCVCENVVFGAWRECNKMPQAFFHNDCFFQCVIQLLRL